MATTKSTKIFGTVVVPMKTNITGVPGSPYLGEINYLDNKSTTFPSTLMVDG